MVQTEGLLCCCLCCSVTAVTFPSCVCSAGLGKHRLLIICLTTDGAPVVTAWCVGLKANGMALAVEAEQLLLLGFSPFWCEVLDCYAPALRV